VAGDESTWQERATIAEQEARQFRRYLDAQGRSSRRYSSS